MATKILVVEDELIVGKMIQQKLLKLGFEVTGHAAYGREAIEMAAETHPDLVLMDIVLKGDMDGISAAHVIINRFQIPIIYLTAYADEKILKRAMITEPYAYILKPFRKEELLANIKMALYKDKLEKRRNEVIIKRLLSDYYEFTLENLDQFEDELDKTFLYKLKKQFGDSFEEEAVISWDYKLENTNLDLDTEDRDIVIEFFSSWITRIYRELGVRNNLISDKNKQILELFNCPWNNPKNNKIFCINCKVMIERSFRWTGLNASIKDINTIMDGSSRCRFIINIRE